MIENLITAHRNRVRQACGGKTRAGVDHFTRIAIKSSLGVRDDDVRIPLKPSNSADDREENGTAGRTYPADHRTSEFLSPWCNTIGDGSHQAIACRIT
jgi:hypothetical protein